MLFKGLIVSSRPSSHWAFCSKLEHFERTFQFALSRPNLMKTEGQNFQTSVSFCLYIMTSPARKSWLYFTLLVSARPSIKSRNIPRSHQSDVLRSIPLGSRFSQKDAKRLLVVRYLYSPADVDEIHGLANEAFWNLHIICHVQWHFINTYSGRGRFRVHTTKSKQTEL